MLALKLRKELYQLFHILPAVDDLAYFHRVTDHHIEDSIFFYLDRIVWVLLFTARAVWLKRFHTA